MQQLEANQRQTQDIMEALLNLINDDDEGGAGDNAGGKQAKGVTLPTSVLIHLLICLSYLSKERFSDSIDQCNFVDRISQFVE